ncbi:hypothetical protein VSS74_30770 [Conexibacter stalactiti]|uniref:DUF5666 domain-containing protein n=1 Tax=Conexibacter stalactiti TaxID=1940611 RepID=A0ABU4I024_9ACTN|nr:hypothetical protein [Conexibacter stalactiti]MDW5598783.1 hypothetical protein [Conexibacter stalactiti]MEC5039425.1 hypothetical protein [Conexibacter stalactiti]
MDIRRSTRIATLVVALLALACASFSATATAHRGSDDDSAKAGRTVVLGTVATVDASARTFTLTVKGHKWHRGGKHHRFARAAHRGDGKRLRGGQTRTVTVRANELALPAVGQKLLVKGTTLEDGTVSATELKQFSGEGKGDCNGRDHDDDDDRRGDDD